MVIKVFRVSEAIDLVEPAKSADMLLPWFRVALL